MTREPVLAAPRPCAARTLTLLALLLPAGAFFGAFFLLPLARLFLVGGSGRDGFATYATIITDRTTSLP